MIRSWTWGLLGSAVVLLRGGICHMTLHRRSWFARGKPAFVQ